MFPIIGSCRRLLAGALCLVYNNGAAVRSRVPVSRNVTAISTKPLSSATSIGSEGRERVISFPGSSTGLSIKDGNVRGTGCTVTGEPTRTVMGIRSTATVIRVTSNEVVDMDCS